MGLKWCPGYTGTGDSPFVQDHAYHQDRHQLEDDSAKGAANVNFGPGKSQCRTCYGVYSRDWRARRKVGGPTAPRRASTAVRQAPVVLPDFRAPALEALEADGDEEFVSDEDLASSRSHAYVPQPQLVEKWAAVTQSAAGGSQPFQLLFLGPKGCGKTEAAEFLAGLVGLPFTKVDGASMTEPESWFGTREVEESEPDAEGRRNSITTYRPSSFVLAVEQPGVVLIDEINRTPDSTRNVLNPLFDNTHQVTNPLTGEVVRKHPKCFVIMSGNRGLNFTGTYAIDPSLMSRALVVSFDYAPAAAEVQIAQEASGCDAETAELFVRFAGETRARSRLNPDLDPMDTREVIAACKLVEKGLSPDSAIAMVCLDSASDEGGAASVRVALEALWTGVRKEGPAKVVLCGVEHPYERQTDAGRVTCAVECSAPDVALAAVTGGHRHPGSPQHKSDGSKRADGQPVTWFD